MDGHRPTWAASDPCASLEQAQCYGEVTELGLRRSLYLMETHSCTITDTSVVYDIGSGHGNVARFFRTQTNASRIVGIEINACRATVAEAQHRKLLARPDFALLHGDVRQLGFDDATHVFLTSQCWDSELLGAIFGQLARRARQLTCVVSVGSLDALASQRLAALAAPFGRVGAIALRVAGTWDANAAAVHIVPARGGGCNRSCVRRTHRILKRAAEHVEADDYPGAELNPWRLASSPVLRLGGADGVIEL